MNTNTKDPFRISDAAMEVSSNLGYMKSLEYVNALRAVMNVPAMSEQEYSSAEDECLKAGSASVTAAHRLATSLIFWPVPTSAPSKPSHA